MPPTERTLVNTGFRRLSLYPDPLLEDTQPVSNFLEENLTMEELKEAFRLFDDLGNGYITVDKFRDILIEIDSEISEEELKAIISEIDTDNSNTIDFEEFVKLMK